MMPSRRATTPIDSRAVDDVDRYINDLFAPPDPALAAALASIDASGMPPIQVSPGQGKFLYLLARLVGARRILEIGTHAGYSTIWLARALPEDGHLVTLELSEKHAAVARANLARAGCSRQVDVIVGHALETLAALARRGEPPFDVVFIDADKQSYCAYLEWSLKLTRSGSLIAIDNVVRAGGVLAPPPGDEAARGARDVNMALASEPRVEAIVLQQVGLKGHDGLALVRVR
jgi:predicted O-methyltransferase YrrM